VFDVTAFAALSFDSISHKAKPCRSMHTYAHIQWYYIKWQGASYKLFIEIKILVYLIIITTKLLVHLK